MNPLVSIIIPHTWERDLGPCIAAIKAQTYKEIEILVIVDNEQKGPGKPRNEGVRIARGKLLLFTDDDIRWVPTAVEKMVDVLESNPGVTFAYCDYEKIGELTGIEKSLDWDPEYIKKRNYISTMCLVRKEKFMGFDESLKRYVDWDYWLRHALKGDVGAYIPEVLFQANFEGTGITAGGPLSRIRHTNILKAKHGISPTYSIIIAAHNELRRTQECIESLIVNTGDDFEIIVINDASTDGTRPYLVGLGAAVKVIHNISPMHHTFCMNQGAKIAQGEYLIILNNDTVVPFPWNVQLKDAFESLEDASCIGPVTTHSASCQELRIESPDGSGVDIRNVKIVQDEIRRTFAQECVQAKITGFCFFTSRKIWDKVGPFDEKIPAGGNEAEWIIRAAEIGLFPYIDVRTFVHHYGNASYSRINTKDIWEQGRQVILDKWGEDKLNWLENDLYKDIYQEFKLVVSK